LTASLLADDVSIGSDLGAGRKERQKQPVELDEMRRRRDALLDIGEGVRDETGERYPSELELNAALNIVSGVRPRNEMEAALAAQMVAIHFMTMKVSGQALGQNWIDPRSTAIAGKLARTFAMQCDTLARLRGRVGKQTIKVRYERHDHRHVHVEEGGAQNGTRAQASTCGTDGNAALEYQPSAALQGQDTAGDTVPGSGGSRESALSNARWGERVRRPVRGA
jgi:hypothetical protein